MYQLRVYSPIEGVTMLYAEAYGWGLMEKAEPLGTSKACINIPDVNSASVISADLEPGYSVSKWVVDIDGVKSSQRSETCTINWSSSISNVQVRLEVVGSAPTTYSATLRFDANGGTGAPSSITETGNGEYVDITIPRDEPTRTGYFFEGWADDDAATKAQYYPGRTYSWYATEAGYTHRLYAVWTKEQTGSVRIGPNFELYTPYIWTSSGWQRATAHIWNNGWKRGS